MRVTIDLTTATDASAPRGMPPTPILVSRTGNFGSGEGEMMDADDARTLAAQLTWAADVVEDAD